MSALFLTFQVSKYAQRLLLNVIDLESASTRDRERIKLLTTTNSTGRPGCCIPTDMCCEHKVRKMKDLFKSFHSQLEPALIEKAVNAQNSFLIMKDHFMDSLGKGDLKSGGGHSHDYFSQDEIYVL